MELLIDKKYLIRLERYTKFGYGGTYDPFAARYVFALPESAGLPAGYTVYIDAERVEWEHDEKGRLFNDSKPLYTRELENNRTYRLDRDSSAVYVAMMTENREEVKKYKRYKYTSEELYALYQNVDLSTAELAVAKIDIYLEGREGNRHKVLYGNRIDRTLYLVGKVQGSWFYCTALDTKRRIGSHGVTILGKIKPEDEREVWQLIGATEKKLERCKDDFSRIFQVKHRMERALDEIKFWSDSAIPKDKDVLKAHDDVQSSAASALQLIERKLSEEENVLIQIAVELEVQLEKFF